MTPSEIKDVISSVSDKMCPYRNGEDRLTLINAIDSEGVSMDTWFTWMESPAYSAHFDRIRRSKNYISQTYARQIIDDTLSGSNDAPPAMAIGLAKDLLSQKKDPDDAPKETPDSQKLLSEMFTIFSKINSDQSKLLTPASYDATPNE